MRILKSTGLVVMAGLYVLLIANVPFLVAAWAIGIILVASLFCYGYFILFNPKK